MRKEGKEKRTLDPNCQVRITCRPISELKLDPKNPRTHHAKQVRQIARSIETFGFNVPVLLDANGKVIAGHGRIMACQLLGRTEVPTICLDHLSEAQAKAFMIADNRLTENSVWDDQLLAEQLRDLSVENLRKLPRQVDSCEVEFNAASKRSW